MAETVDWKAWHSRNKTKREKLETKSRKGGKGGGTPTWALRAKYLKAPPGSELWLKPQAYKGEVFYEFYARFVTTYDDKNNERKRNVMSNSHNGELPVPCLLWYYCAEEENENLYANQNFAVSVAVMHDFHKVPRTSKKGSKYHDLVQCGGKDRYGRPTCELCDNGVETVYGDQKYWSMWPSMKKSIEEQISAIPGRCANCKTGELSVFGFECSSCGEVLANQYHSPISADDEDRFLSGDVSCPKCKKDGRAKQLYECAKKVGDDWERGCDSPRLHDFGPDGFDISNYDIRLKFEKVGNATKVTIVDFRKHNPEALRADIRAPMDMDQFLGHMTLEEQAQQLNRINPFPPAAEKALAEFFTTPPDKADDQSLPWPSASTATAPTSIVGSGSDDDESDGGDDDDDDDEFTNDN